MNISLIKEVEKMSGYIKFMKYLVRKKSIMCYYPIDNFHQCSAKSS